MYLDQIYIFEDQRFRLDSLVVKKNGVLVPTVQEEEGSPLLKFKVQPFNTTVYKKGVQITLLLFHLLPSATVCITFATRLPVRSSYIPIYPHQLYKVLEKYREYLISDGYK